MRSEDIWESVCTAVVFCGGRGTRLQPILQGKPKALVEVADRPYLDGLLRSLRKAGVRRVVLCISGPTLAIAGQIGDGGRYGLRVRYTLDSGDVENAGALWSAF